MGNWWHNDDMVDAHFSKDYYAPGTDYFDPPEEDEDYMDDEEIEMERAELRRQYELDLEFERAMNK